MPRLIFENFLTNLSLILDNARLLTQDVRDHGTEPNMYRNSVQK